MLEGSYRTIPLSKQDGERAVLFARGWEVPYDRLTRGGEPFIYAKLLIRKDPITQIL